MCGIAGLYDSASSPDKLRENLAHMTGSLAHRGPDSDGLWLDPQGGLGLGHRRLAIIDLSEKGAQPMASPGGRYMIVFNGEIYNYIDIRRELEQEGQRFISHSDTEVLLAGAEHWGLKKTLEKCSGMFALALWDKKERNLHLARDRIGKKPLYFGYRDGKFAFCSELKALHALKTLSLEIDRDSLALFLRQNYIPAPWSVYKGVYKLPPGHIASLPLNETADWSEASLFQKTEPYWTAKNTARKGLANPLRGGEEEALNRLDAVLTKAVTERMIADVPLGAFLSGGIDSSLVVSIMARQGAGARPKTFSIGYDEQAFNEARYAKNVARHLGTDHTELYLRPDDALDVLSPLPEIYDEPFADPSQIPTWHVSRLARGKVTVALSGDGGDESFFGYRRYIESRNLKNLFSVMPGPLKPLLGKALLRLPEERWDELFSSLRLNSLSSHIRGRRMHALAGLLSQRSAEDFYEWLMADWKEPLDLVTGAAHRSRHFDAYDTRSLKCKFTARMMLHDQLNYLPDDNLVKVDRASMAHALEVRCPLLDHRVIELAWRIPFALKYRDGHGKYILRRLLERYLPVELFNRPKQGFAVPVGAWLRGPLKDWGAALLDESRLREQGFLDPDPILKKWREHQNGVHDWHPRLWNVLMFQLWLERWHK